MGLRIAVIFALLWLSNPVSAGQNSETVEQFIEAFNEKDVNAMLALSAPDLSWMSISGDQLSIETSSHAELHAGMTDYFQSTPGTRSKVRSMKETGTFVYTVEEAFWLSAGEEKSQCSIAVYEFNGDKIQNVWYFPEHSCE